MTKEEWIDQCVKTYNIWSYDEENDIDLAELLSMAWDAAIESITPEQKKIFGCHVDGEPPYKACVLEYRKPDDCIYAKLITSRESCGYWLPIG